MHSSEGEAEIKEEAIARIKVRINDITCLRCTKKNPLGSKFCRHCGNKL
ncbi:zinc-ribbon domain-containing protein [Candidatus Nitrososphaera gargensis]|nr:zinc-ribbon domain-containing protein [Candidatus Nitrososphaera gargensis]